MIDNHFDNIQPGKQDRTILLLSLMYIERRRASGVRRKIRNTDFGQR